MAFLGTINIIFSADFHNILKNIISKQPVNYNIGVSLGMIISIFIIMIAAVIIVDQIAKNAFNENNNTNKLTKALTGGVVGAALMLLFVRIWKFGSQIIFTVNIILSITVLIVLFITHKVLSRI